MTTSIQALREQHSELVKQANHLLAEKGDQVWTKDDQSHFDSMMDKADGVKAKIDAYNRVQQQEVEDDFKDIDDFKTNNKQQKNQSQQAFDLFLRKSDKQMNQEEALLIYNTMSTTTGSEGGYTVQSEIAKELIEAKKDYGAMRREASQITTSMGNDLSYPTSDGTSEQGEWVAQNTASNDADVSFGTVALNVFKAGSKVITVPIELIQDSNIDIQALVFSRVVSRIGRVEDAAFTTGSGTGQPMGIVTASSVGVTGATGQTITITYEDLIDLEESLDVAYTDYATSKPCWMMGQALRKVIRKLKDSAGRPIWTPSYDAGIAGAKASQLLGYDVCMNNNMPSPAANAKSLAFGDLSRYMIRDALQVSFFRFDDSAFVKKGQIGFLAWARTGGNLLDTNSTKLYRHSAT